MTRQQENFNNQSHISLPFKSKKHRFWDMFFMVSMYILCALCLISGIHCLIFPESSLINFIFPIFTIICVIEIIISSIIRVYNSKTVKKHIQLAMEQANAAAEARNIFCANISHELRTPINIMQGMNEMIIRESTSSDITEYAKNVSIAGRNMERIVNNLIIYSRITTGYFDALNFQFDMLDFLTNYTNTLTSYAKRNNCTINLFISPSISRDTIGDNALLESLLDNITAIPLILNDTPTINLSFTWDKKSDKSGILLIHMENMGIILDEKCLYYLYNNPTSSSLSNLQGLNFNISIIRYILDVLKGTIELSNNTDKGIEFYIEIPYQLTADKQLTQSITSKSKDISSFTAPDAHILVVDDHNLNLEVMTKLLKRTEMQINVALSGEEALLLIERNNYHIILIDYMMPDMDGIELLENIKVQYPDIYKHTPIFALSASTTTDIIHKLKSCGFKDFIPKPVESNVLELVIKENLPANLVNETYTKNNSDIFTPEINNKFKNLLKQYDIIISEGLKYMSGDPLQYYTVASLIAKNYEKNLTNIETLHKNGNYKDLGIAIHALKGNARFIGATTLYTIAMNIESKTSQNELEFVDIALPLLKYQWEKTIDGINIFIEEFQQMGLIEENKDFDEVIDEDYLEKLMEYTDNFQPEPALKLIQQILKQDLTSEQTKKLRLAAEYLEELEYDEAMTIFKEMIL